MKLTDAKETIAFLVVAGGLVIGYHKLDLVPDRAAQNDVHTEAVISRLLRLCNVSPELMADRPDWRTNREILKTKYKKLTGREWTGCD